MAHGHRIRSYALSGSGIGVGPLGGFAGYALVGVMDDRGLCKLALRADSPLGPFARECPGDLGGGASGRSGACPGGPGLSLGGGRSHPTLSSAGRAGGGDGVAKVDGKGQELDRDPLQRDGAFPGASPD